MGYQVKNDELVEMQYSDFGDIFDDLLNEIYLFDIEDLFFINANKGACNNTGYELEELLTLTPLDLKPLYSKQEFENLLRPLRLGEAEKITFETVHKRKDGSLYPVEVHIQLTQNRPETAFVAIILDITERQKNYRLLEEKGQRLSAILNGAIESIISIDCNGIIESLNPATENIFGYSESELIGKSINILIPELWRSEHDHYMKQYLLTGTKKIIGIDREVSGQRKDGSIFPLELSVSEVIVDKERSFTGIIRDISDRKEAERQLMLGEEEADRSRERFTQLSRIISMGEMAASIAHEINQPLAAIGTYAQACNRLIKSEQHNIEELYLSLEKIGEQTQRASKVIQRLRALMNKHDTQYISVDMNVLVDEMIELSKSRLISNDIEIEVIPLSEVRYIECDPIQIQQVILNLINNAIDSMSSDAASDNKIIISISIVNENTISVSVKDFGIGISEKDKDSVFSTFFTTKENGMGVGLSICRSIIEAHGGNLVLNNSTGKGSEFCFTLPVTQKR